MTRKDYVRLAAALREENPMTPEGDVPVTFGGGFAAELAHGHYRATIAIAAALGAENPRFDRDRFLVAAGYMAES
jgi:hypothetical protein